MRRRPFCLLPLLHPTLAWPATSLEIRTSGQEANLLKFDPKNEAMPGFSVELMRALTRIDPALQFTGAETLRTVRRVEEDLAKGTLELFFGLVSNEARRARFVLVEEPPLYVQFTQLAVNADDPISIQALADIRALGSEGIIGVPQGSAFVEYLKAVGGLSVDDGTPSMDGTLAKLQKRRIRFVFFGGAVLQRTLRDRGLEREIRLLPVRFNREPVCLAAHRQIDPIKLARVRRALEAMKASGDLAALQARYGVAER